MAGGKIVPMLDAVPHHQDVWDSGVGCLNSYLEWTAPCLGCFTCRGMAVITLWYVAGWATTDLDTVGKGKIFASAKN